MFMLYDGLATGKLEKTNLGTKMTRTYNRLEKTKKAIEWVDGKELRVVTSSLADLQSLYIATVGTQRPFFKCLWLVLHK